jgi:hypothetical protein
LVDDLLRLEKGVDGIQAGVVLYVGDNLEMHDIGGFSRCFSKGHICRFCQIHSDDLPQSDGYIKDKLWSPESYDTICSSIENDEEVENFSLRERCILNQLESFHATTSMPPDLMHDVLEGVIVNDLLGVLKCLQKDEWFTVEQYNEQLR